MPVELEKVISAIYDHVSSDAGVTAFFGTSIYNGLAEQNVPFPYLVFFIVDNSPIDVQNANQDSYSLRVQFSVYHSKEGGPAKTLAGGDAVNAALYQQTIPVTDHQDMRPRLEQGRGPLQDAKAWRVDQDWEFFGFEDSSP